VATPASSPSLAEAVAPYPGAGTGFPYASRGFDDRYGYAPANPAAVGFAAPHFPGTEYVNMGEVFADGGYTSPKPVTNPMAKTALWVSVFAIFGLPLIVGLTRAHAGPGRVGAREAIAALVFNGILVVGAVILYLIGNIV